MLPKCFEGNWIRLGLPGESKLPSDSAQSLNNVPVGNGRSRRQRFTPNSGDSLVVKLRAFGSTDRNFTYARQG